MPHTQNFALLKEFTRPPAVISLLRHLPDSMRQLAWSIDPADLRKKRINIVKYPRQTQFLWVCKWFFKKHCIFTTFDITDPAVRLYFCLNKNVQKVCIRRSGLLRPLHFQVWNCSKVIWNFSVSGDDLDLKFVFAFACQVIRNFTETYDWMPILASNLLLMSILINSTSLEFYETDFYGEIISKILQCLFDHAW